ncbi:MAG TPA: hypothetical protein VNV17_25375 [Solirubrobacteraceae bacterium]|jgi:hypothetical protein|nr:hypothetical protein [Solirubrobacteraceae bacterium]
MAELAAAPVTPSRRACTAVTRYAGALVLLAVGLDHLEQYTADSYSAIPTIGTLFLVNFIAAAALALALTAPVERLPGRAGRVAIPLLAAGGIGVAAGSLVGVIVSESTGLFGFMETGYRSSIVVSIALEVVTIMLLLAHLVLRLPSAGAVRPAPRPQRVP